MKNKCVLHQMFQVDFNLESIPRETVWEVRGQHEVEEAREGEYVRVYCIHV